MKILVFTVESRYARFRCPYTTTSALTYSTIHPPAVKGMLGAIEGVDYSDLYNFLKDFEIAIQVINEVCKDTQSSNLIAMTGNNNASNFQSRVQFLRDVKYRIFVRGLEDKLISISDKIKERKPIFTPYMGASEYVASLEYEGIYDASETDDNSSDTIVYAENADFEPESDTVYTFDRIPVESDSSREYIDYKKIIFSSGKRLTIKGKTLVKIGSYNVFFL